MGSDNRLTFSVAKTQGVMFCRKKWSTSAILMMDTQAVTLETEVNYLGMMLRNDLRLG